MLWLSRAREQCIAKAGTWMRLRDKSGEARRDQEKHLCDSWSEREYHAFIHLKPIQFDWTRVSSRERDRWPVLMSSGQQGKAETTLCRKAHGQVYALKRPFLDTSLLFHSISSLLLKHGGGKEENLFWIGGGKLSIIKKSWFLFVFFYAPWNFIALRKCCLLILTK